MDINLQVFLLISLVMAIIIALLFIINTIFTKKISAKIRYFMWVVIMVGLLIPFRPVIGDGIVDVSYLTTPPIELAEPTLPETGSVADVETPEPPSVILPQDVVVNEQISFQTVVLIIWATVAIGIISYHLFQYIRFQGAIKRWGELENDVHTLEIFERIKQEMNLGRSKVQLVVCGFVTTSMLTGFFKPVILLPERNYDDAELELIFRHELIHYQRKDLWIKLLSVIAVAIHWFNPFVYLMNIALQTEGEASCDQKVLEISELKSRHFYAEVIIGMIGGKKSGMTILATNFYGGKKGIKKRLEEIMAGTAPRKSISYMFLMLVLLLTIMSGSVFAMQTPTHIEGNVTESPIDENDDVFELAINAVGGGVVTDYLPFSSELMFVFVTYEDVVYLVEIDMINHSVIGLSIRREEDVPMTDNSEHATDEPSETEPNTDSSQVETQMSEISSERAVEIAMSVAPGRLVEVSRDWENGRPAWWIEIRHNGMVHEFYIDMETGAILEHEYEIDD